MRAAIHGSFTVDPEPMAADGQRYASPNASICEARASACVSTYSRMFVSLPLRTMMAKTQLSLNALFVALIFPVATPTTRTRSPCATNSGGLWVCHFHLVGSLLKHFRQSRVPAVRTGQGPVLARNDPLNIFDNQRQQTLLVAAAQCCKEILHSLDILFGAHRVSSTAVTSDCVGPNQPTSLKLVDEDDMR